MKYQQYTSSDVMEQYWQGTSTTVYMFMLYQDKGEGCWHVAMQHDDP